MATNWSKGNWQVGEVAFDGYMGRLRVLEVDDHPLEYAQLYVEMLDSPALPVPRMWVSERNLRRA